MNQKLEAGGFGKKEPHYTDNVRIETKHEASARREGVRAWVEFMEELDDRTNAFLARQGRMDYVEARMHFRQVLQNTPLSEDETIGGFNETKRLTLMNGDEVVSAFEKSELDEAFHVINPRDELVRLNKELIKKDGDTRIKTSFSDHTKLQYDEILHRSKSVKDAMEDAEIQYLGTEHGYGLHVGSLDPEQAFGMRSMRERQSIKNEAATSLISDLLGIGVCPYTMVTTDGEVLKSRQLGIENTHSFVSYTNELCEFVAAIKRGESHPAKDDLMRAACLHWITGHLDGHPGNLLYTTEVDEDGETLINSIVAIDNGYIQSLSYKSSNNELKAIDPMRSIAMQMIDLDQEWKVDDEVLGMIRTIRDEILDHLRYKAMLDGVALKSDTKRLQALPDHVKSGEVAELFGDILRAIHDVPGDAASTEAIAIREAANMLKRLDYILIHKRPQTRKTGLKNAEFEDYDAFGVFLSDLNPFEPLSETTVDGAAAGGA